MITKCPIEHWTRVYQNPTYILYNICVSVDFVFAKRFVKPSASNSQSSSKVNIFGRAGLPQHVLPKALRKAVRKTSRNDLRP